MTICNRPHPKIIKINNSKIILTTKDDSYESKSLRNFFSLYITMIDKTCSIFPSILSNITGYIEYLYSTLSTKKCCPVEFSPLT